MAFDPSKVTLEADEKAFIQWYDARCKRILSNKMLLAHLMRATMHEYADVDPEVIATRYIEGIAAKENLAPKIQGLRNERNAPNRTANFFDVLFYALLPGSEQYIPIFINVEPQSDFTPGYELQNRGVFYLGCMIADQKDSVFEKSNYDDLRKVCSIWICLEPPKELANTIVSYTLEQHNLLGNCPDHPIDKLQLVMVHLGTENDDNYTGVMPLLDVCLSKTATKDRQQQVTKQYHVMLEQEDCDMTAGEQIIYKLKREAYEREEIGKEIGEEIGKENEKQRIAKSMKNDGVKPESISLYTGLTQEQIQAL